MRGLACVAILAFVASLSFATAAQAQMGQVFDRVSFRTGEDLFRDCAAAEGFERGVCFGYVMGIADALGSIGAKIDGLQACPEGDPSIERLVEIVVAFLAENQASRAIKADGLVAYALSLEYPCEQR